MTWIILCYFDLKLMLNTKQQHIYRKLLNSLQA